MHVHADRDPDVRGRCCLNPKHSTAQHADPRFQSLDSRPAVRPRPPFPSPPPGQLSAPCDTKTSMLLRTPGDLQTRAQCPNSGEKLDLAMQKLYTTGTEDLLKAGFMKLHQTPPQPIPVLLLCVCNAALVVPAVSMTSSCQQRRTPTDEQHLLQEAGQKHVDQPEGWCRRSKPTSTGSGVHRT